MRPQFDLNCVACWHLGIYAGRPAGRRTAHGQRTGSGSAPRRGWRRRRGRGHPQGARV